MFIFELNEENVYALCGTIIRQYASSQHKYIISQPTIPPIKILLHRLTKIRNRTIFHYRILDINQIYMQIYAFKFTYKRIIKFFNKKLGNHEIVEKTISCSALKVYKIIDIILYTADVTKFKLQNQMTTLLKSVNHS